MYKKKTLQKSNVPQKEEGLVRRSCPPYVQNSLKSGWDNCAQEDEQNSRSRKVHVSAPRKGNEAAKEPPRTSKPNVCQYALRLARSRGVPGTLRQWS